jgi:hypothetical protein
MNIVPADAAPVGMVTTTFDVQLKQEPHAKPLRREGKRNNDLDKQGKDQR